MLFFTRIGSKNKIIYIQTDTMLKKKDFIENVTRKENFLKNHMFQEARDLLKRRFKADI